MGRGILLGFALGILTPPVWSDIDSDVAYLKAKFVLGSAAEIVEALRDDERLTRIRGHPDHVRRLCTWAAECAPIYAGPEFVGDPKPIIEQLWRLSGAAEANPQRAWARAEVGVLRARLGRSVRSLLRRAWEIAEHTRNSDHEPAGLLRCVELHLEARHMTDADAEAIVKGLRGLRDRAKRMDIVTHKAADAALRLEAPEPPTTTLSRNDWMRELLVRTLVDPHRHNDFVNKGGNRRWRPFEVSRRSYGGRLAELLPRYYRGTHFELDGLDFAFPLSRNWRVFPIELPEGLRLVRFQRVTKGGVGIGHIDVTYGAAPLTNHQIDERFLNEVVEFPFSRGLCTLRPRDVTLRQDLPEARAYAIWGWRRDGTFSRRRAWMFPWNGTPVWCRSVEYRDEQVIPELNALLVSFHPTR